MKLSNYVLLAIPLGDCCRHRDPTLTATAVEYVIGMQTAYCLI